MMAFIDRDGVLSIYPQDPQEEFALDCWIEKNVFLEKDTDYNPGRGPASCPCIGIRTQKFQPRPDYSKLFQQLQPTEAPDAKH